MIEYSEDWQSFRDLTFKNPLESHFSFNKKCFVGRAAMNQHALYFPDLGDCFTYSEVRTYAYDAKKIFYRLLKSKPSPK